MGFHSLVSVWFMSLIMLVCFWKYVCYFATYDCATTVALECIDRASFYYKKLWKIKTKLLFELFCERIHFSKEAFQFAANLQHKCMHTKTFRDFQRYVLHILQPDFAHTLSAPFSQG